MFNLSTKYITIVAIVIINAKLKCELKKSTNLYIIYISTYLYNILYNQINGVYLQLKHYKQYFKLYFQHVILEIIQMLNREQ